MNAITVARDSVALARQARLDARSGRFTGPTANLAPGHVQANLAILPRAGGRLPAFLPAQSQALSLAGHVRAGRSLAAGTRAGHRHPQRHPALSRLEAWRVGGRAHRRARLVARRPGVLPDRLLVLVRGSHAGQRPARASHPAGLQRPYTGPTCRRSAPACSAVPWSCPCAPEGGGRDTRHPGHFAFSLVRAPVHLGDPS